jgi:hypothetical protein
MIDRDTLAICRVCSLNTARGGDLIREHHRGFRLGKSGWRRSVLEDERVFRGGATKILSQKIAERVRSRSDAVRETSAQRVAEFSKSWRIANC